MEFSFKSRFPCIAAREPFKSSNIDGFLRGHMVFFNDRHFLANRVT